MAKDCKWRIYTHVSFAVKSRRLPDGVYAYCGNGRLKKARTKHVVYPKSKLGYLTV